MPLRATRVYSLSKSSSPFWSMRIILNVTATPGSLRRTAHYAEVNYAFTWVNLKRSVACCEAGDGCEGGRMESGGGAGGQPWLLASARVLPANCTHWACAARERSRDAA